MPPRYNWTRTMFYRPYRLKDVSPISAQRMASLLHTRLFLSNKEQEILGLKKKFATSENSSNFCYIKTIILSTNHRTTSLQYFFFGYWHVYLLAWERGTEHLNPSYSTNKFLYYNTSIAFSKCTHLSSGYPSYSLIITFLILALSFPNFSTLLSCSPK